MKRKLVLDNSKRVFLFISIFIVVLCLGVVYAKSSKEVIEYVYPDQSIWTTKRNQDGVLANPLLEYAEVLFSRYDVVWAAKPYPAKRMFDRLEQGVSKFSILVQAPRLNKCCIFSKKPVTYSELKIYRSPNTDNIFKLEDLRGKSIITIRGYSYGSIGRYLRNKENEITIHEAPGHSSAFEMLRHGRANYLLNYSGPSNEILSVHPMKGMEEDTLTRLYVYLVLSRSYPDAENVMSTLEGLSHHIDVTQWGLNAP